MSTRADATDGAFWADADDGVALQRYRTLVNTVDDGIYQLDAAGRFVAVNNIIVELTGYSRDELLGEHVSLVLEDTDVERIGREISKCLEGESELNETFEFTARTADDEPIPCELQMSLLVEDGAFEGSVGIVRDVTDKKRAEQTLNEHERTLQRERDVLEQVLKTSPVGIQVLDADGTITRMNDRCRELLEISSEEAERYDPSDRTVYNENGREITVEEHPFAQTLETGEPVYDKVFRVELPSGDSRWISVNAAPILTDDGEIDCVVTTAENITELKERERELSTELDEVFGRISDAFYALDEEWRFTHVNEHAAEFMGQSQTELPGKSIWDVFPEAIDSDLYDRFHEAMDTQDPVSFERYSEPFGIWAEVNAYPSETGLSVYFRDITERKEREEDLELFRSLIDQSNDSVLVIDPETGRILDANDTACRRLGYERTDLLERSIPDIETELPDRDAWQAHVENVRSKGALTFKGEHQRADGTTLPVEVNVSHVELDREYMLAVARDVTERRKRERKLAESEQRYRTLAECFPNGIVTLFDADLEYTLAAGRAFDDLPVDPDDVEGNFVQDVWDEATADALEPRLRAALDGEESSIELEYAGREWVIHVVPVANDSGDVFAGMTMAQDITERKENERQLREREQDLEQYREYTSEILDAIDDIFYVLDDTGALKRWNESVATVTGYTDGEIETMNALDFFDEPDQEPIANAIAEGFEAGTTQVQANLQTEDADTIPYEFVANTLENPDGDRVLVGIGRDITDREEKRRQLEETIDKLEESNERLEQFAYAASHDLQEPLRMIMSYLQLLESRYSDAFDADGQEFLEFAVDGADRMREMVDALLEYSRIETRGDPFKPTDLESVLGDVIDDLQVQIEETDAEITIDNLPIVEGDECQLRQVFQNLLDNALTYHGDEPPQVHIDAEQRGRKWLISVRDGGIGIAPEDQNRVFTVFDRLHSREEYEGTGIGLALCQRIVERHEGEIWVESEPDEGATFTLTLREARGR